jgi:hypothetical protein
MVVDLDVAGRVRRAVARGQDIGFTSAPWVVEAAARMRQFSFRRSGALTLAEAFYESEFLQVLVPPSTRFLIPTAPAPKQER